MVVCSNCRDSPAKQQTWNNPGLARLFGKQVFSFDTGLMCDDCLEMFARVVASEIFPKIEKRLLVFKDAWRR